MRRSQRRVIDLSLLEDSLSLGSPWSDRASPVIWFGIARAGPVIEGSAGVWEG